MIVVGRADKMVVADLKFIPQLPKFSAYLVSIGLRRVAFFCGGLFDLLSVLVGAGHKVRIIAL